MPIEIRRKEVRTLVAQGRAQLVEVLPASLYKKEHLPHAVVRQVETGGRLGRGARGRD